MTPRFNSRVRLSRYESILRNREPPGPIGGLPDSDPLILHDIQLRRRLESGYASAAGLADHHPVRYDEISTIERHLILALTMDAESAAELPRPARNAREAADVGGLGAGAGPGDISKSGRNLGFRKTRPPHRRKTIHRLSRANEYRATCALVFGDGVEAVMYSVDEVDVGMPRRTKHDPASGRGTAKRVRSGIIGQVGLGFDDARNANVVGDTAND